MIWNQMIDMNEKFMYFEWYKYLSSYHRIILH